MSGSRQIDTTILDDDDYINDHVRKDAYHLASSDSPHLILTQVHLKEDNYDEWVKAMCLALRAKKKLSFAEGLIPKPKPGTTEEEEWWTVNKYGWFMDFKHH